MSVQASLFSKCEEIQTLRPGVILLPSFFVSVIILPEIKSVLQKAVLRYFITPGGKKMSVAMSNCGDYGWISDRKGYRYSREDPLSKKPWPPIPPLLYKLVQEAAELAGFPKFDPNVCLINCYQPGAKMSLHQDKDEADALRGDAQPIVSFSLGLPAIFLLGGLKRSDKTQSLVLQDGDALVFGGPARLMFHGIKPLAAGEDALLGAQRINLTFRRAYN